MIKDQGKLNQVSELTQLSALSSESDVQVLLSGQQISIQSCIVPKGTKKKIEQVLRALLEEILAEDIERLHFVALEFTKEKVTVAVIARAYLQACLDWLDQAGLQAERLTPTLILLAKGCPDNRVTLLTGSYRQNKKMQIPLWEGFQVACIALLCFVLLSFIEKGLILHRLTKEAQQTQEKAEEAYQSLFLIPQKVVNLAAQFKALKNQMKTQPRATHLMNFFSRFATAISDINIKPEEIQLFALRYDRQKHTLYLQIGVNDFSEFEQLRLGLSKYFSVEQGILVQEKKRVNGTLTLKEKKVEERHLKEQKRRK